MPRVSSLSVVIFAAVVLQGCSTTHSGFEVRTPRDPLATKAPLKLALILTPKLCTYTYDNGNLSVFNLGPTICEAARTAATQAFELAVFPDSAPQASSTSVDAVAELQVRSAAAYIVKGVLPAATHTGLVVDWSFRTLDGRSAYQRRLDATGVDVRMYGMADARYRASMQQCMDDLATKLEVEMRAAPEKGQQHLQGRAQILARVGGYRTGETTYRQFLRDKTDLWVVETAYQRITGAGIVYEYVAAAGPKPAELRMHSKGTIGEGRTIFGGVGEDRRLDRMLERGEIQRSPGMQYLVRQLIGAVHADEPLCEVEFRGNSPDEATLSAIKCSPVPSLQ